MDEAVFADGTGLQTAQRPAIRFLVEAALRNVTRIRVTEAPTGRDDRVARLVEALTAPSEACHVSVVAALMARGVGRRELIDDYIPSAALRLGELWVADRASFVEVTVGAGRLQALIRDHASDLPPQPARGAPPPRSFLMIVPRFEDHSLGAFVAADQLRRLGVSVRMGIGLRREELVHLVERSGFSALGLTAATESTLEKAAELIEYLRSNLDHVPPVMIGGRAVRTFANVAELTGADHAVKTAHEALERCDRWAIGTGSSFERLR